MKYGVLITARLKSTRLKKKLLKVINNQKMITYLIDRLKKHFPKKKKVCFWTRFLANRGSVSSLGNPHR